MAGGVTTVEIKSGYGLDVDTELKMLRAAGALGASEKVRVARDPARAARAAARIRRAAARVRRAGDRNDDPGRGARGAGEAVDAFCEGIGFTADEVDALFEAAAAHGLRVKLHAEQLSNLHGAALAAEHKALSADHLEHLDEAGAAAMAEAGMVAVLLPGAFYALQGNAQAAGRAAAPPQGADGGGDRLQSRHLAGHLADPDDEHGLHPVRADAGGGAGRNDARGRAGAGPCRTRSAR